MYVHFNNFFLHLHTSREASHHLHTVKICTKSTIQNPHMARNKSGPLVGPSNCPIAELGLLLTWITFIARILINIDQILTKSIPTHSTEKHL